VNGVSADVNGQKWQGRVYFSCRPGAFALTSPGANRSTPTTLDRLGRLDRACRIRRHQSHCPL